jgi:hypothetical protein
MEDSTMNRAFNRWSLVLLLAALFALFVAAQVGAQTQPAPAATAMSASTADFLATLSAVPSSGQDGLAPSPVLDSGCTSNAQCPKGQLCCLACGYAGCETRACFVPMNGHCPFFP